MPPPPPLKDVLTALQLYVLPGAGGAALVMCVFLLLGRRATATGSAVAVVVAFMWGNFTLDYVGSDPLGWENTSRLLKWKPDETSPGYHWLARAALVLVFVGLASRWLGLLTLRFLPDRFWWVASAPVWLPRIAAVFVVSAWLVVGKAGEAEQWSGLRWQLATVMLLIWFVLDGLARTEISAEVAASTTAMLYAGSAVLLYSHNAKFMELAVLIGSAMFGIALATTAVKRYAENGAKFFVSGAIPAAVLFLPGLVLGTRPSHADNKVPAICFWLVALAPLMLSPFLIPRVTRQNRWLLLGLRVLAVLVPLVIAVLLAAQYEKLPHEELED